MKNKKPYNSRMNSDEHIKSMFQDFQASYDPDSWDLLSQKMDNATPFVSLKDSEIKEELTQISMPYDSASWNVLEQRLDLFDTRKRWIFRGKVLELAMFFFLFYFFADTLNQAFEFKNNDIEIASDNSEIFTHPDEDESAINPLEPVEAASPDVNQNNQSANLLKGSDLKVNKRGKLSEEHVTGSINTSLLNSLKLGDSEFSHPSLPVAELNSDTETPFHENLNPLSSTSDLGLASDKDLNDIEKDNLAKLPLIVSQIEQDNLVQDDLILPALYPGNFNDKKFSFLLGAVIGYDKDLIKSPYPHQTSEVMLGRIEDNFRMGLNLSMEMNAVEITAGVHYLIKNYKSVYAGENQVRIANIPIMLKLKLPFAGFMRGYVSGGVSGNYVIHANYQEHDYFRDRPQLDYIENNARAAGYSLLSSTSYKNGIFEGETIRGNHFYTANIAIGLEAHLNKTYSLFFEQAYSHHLKGSAIGPAFDHFFSSTSLMGLRYRILKNSNRVLHTKAGNTFR